MTKAIDTKDFMKFIKTKADAATFQQILEKLADGLYKTDSDPEEALLKSVTYEQAMLLKHIATETGVNMDDKSQLQNFYRSISKSFSDIPVITITVAIQPKGKLVTKMHDWFYRNFRKSILLDIQIKPSIIAGSIISYNGKFYDYSVEKQANELLGRGN